MNKIAFIFPGQGSQYIGMGKEFYLNNPISKEIYKQASAASGIDVEDLCFSQNDEINITQYTQIAMLATEVAILKAVEEAGIVPDVTAGLSLGEYAALVASKVLTPEDAFGIVRQRGILMEQAVPTGGAMTAILALEANKIEQICNETEGIVSIANYNCPGQIVITGEEQAVGKAAAACLEAGAKRCISLKVSGPFHSAMLEKVSDQLGEALQKVTIHNIAIPYLTNVTGKYVTSCEDVIPTLMKQVASSVKWQQSIEQMLADGVTEFVEIGPGKTLTGFMKKINKDVHVMNIETIEDLEHVKTYFAARS